MRILHDSTLTFSELRLRGMAVADAGFAIGCDVTAGRAWDNCARSVSNVEDGIISASVFEGTILY